MIRATLIVALFYQCNAAWGDNCCTVENGTRKHNLDNSAAVTELLTFPPWPVMYAIDHSSRSCSNFTTKIECEMWGRWEKTGGCDWVVASAACVYTPWNTASNVEVSTDMAKVYDVNLGGKETFHIALVGAFFADTGILSSGRIAVYHINNKIDEHCPGLKSTFAETAVNAQDGYPDPGFIMTYDAVGLDDSALSAYVAGTEVSDRVYTAEKTVLNNSVPLVDGVISGFVSADTMALSNVLGQRGIPTIGTTTTTDELSDKEKYPYYFRVIGNDKINSKSIGYILKNGMGISKVVAIWSAHPYTKAGFDTFSTSAAGAGVDIVYALRTPEGAYQGAPVIDSFLPELDRAFTAIRQLGVKAIVAFCYRAECDSYRTYAEKHNIVAGFTWIGTDGMLRSNWPSAYMVMSGAEEEDKVDDWRAYFKDVIRDSPHSARGGPMKFCEPDDDAFSDTNVQPKATTSPCYQRGTWDAGTTHDALAYTEYSYDAFFLIHHLYTLNRNWLRNKRRRNGLNIDSWKEDYDPLDLWRIAKNLHEMNRDGPKFSFDGLTGNITFNAEGDRNSPVAVYNSQNGDWIRVGTWTEEEADKVHWSPGKSLSVSTANGSKELFLTASMLSLLPDLPDPGGRSTCKPSETAVEGCQECEPGYGLQIVVGVPTCVQCVEGQVKADKGQKPCLPCQPGTYSANPRSTECLPCPIGTFTDQPQMSQCLSCDFSISGMTFYQDETGQANCKPCPVGGSCRPEPLGPHAGLVITFQSGVGFQKLVDNTTGVGLLLPCRPPEACLGYNMVEKHMICAEGMDHHTPYCGLCKVGYSREVDSEVCKPCQAYFSLALAAISLYIFVLIAANHNPYIRRTNQRIALRMLGNWFGILWVALSVIPYTNSPLPSRVVDIFVWGSGIFANSFRHSVSMSCMIQTASNYEWLAFETVYATVVGAAFLYVFTLMLYALIQLVWLRKCFSLASLIRAYTIVTFVILPFVAHSVLSLVRCADLDVPRLQLNYAIKCSDVQQHRVFLVGVLSVFGYCVGFLLVLAMLMRSNRKSLFTGRFQHRYGFFVTGYRVECFWFECYHMLRKVLFPWVAIFYDDYENKVVILLCCIVLFLFVQIHFHPYDRRENDILNRLEIRGLMFLLAHLGVVVTTHMSVHVRPLPRTIIDTICAVCWVVTACSVVSGYLRLLFGSWFYPFFARILNSRLCRSIAPRRANPIVMTQNSSVFKVAGLTTRELNVLSQVRYEIMGILFRQKCTIITDVHIGFVLENLRQSILYNVEKLAANPPLSIRILRLLGVSAEDMGLSGKIYVNDLYFEVLRFECVLTERLASTSIDQAGLVPVTSLGRHVRLGDLEEHRWGELLCPFDSLDSVSFVSVNPKTFFY